MTSFNTPPNPEYRSTTPLYREHTDTMPSYRERANGNGERGGRSERNKRSGRGTHANGSERLPLLRPKRGRILCGVCRGVALHLGVSVWIVRLVFIVAACCFGSGIVTYIFLWLFVPSGDPIIAAQMITFAKPVSQSPLSRGNAVPASNDTNRHARTGSEADVSEPENLTQAIKRASKPALIALSGAILLALAVLMSMGNVEAKLVLPIIFAIAGITLTWLQYNAREGQLWAMVGGVLLLFAAYATFATLSWWQWTSPLPIIGAGLALLAGVGVAIVPWLNSLIRELGTERALKEREEERADMTAHLHDGVLQTLALIQLHSNEPTTVFTLARQQERELREWLYQERTTSDRSVSAGIKTIAARVEDEHGRPIDVVCVGDAQPSAQTDALLDATAQALVNAVTHGGEPISMYCEAGVDTVEVFVRDHGNGFDVNAIPEGRLGIRESIIGRIRRRGGTVEIVSRPGWGTEVRMHMPIVAGRNGVRDGHDERNGVLDGVHAGDAGNAGSAGSARNVHNDSYNGRGE